MPIELLQICPASIAEVLCELIAAGGKIKCVMNDWDILNFILIHKEKWFISVPANNRLLRLILILRKK